MKKLLTSVLLCGALLSLSACGSDDKETSSNSSEAKSSEASSSEQKVDKQTQSKDKQTQSKNEDIKKELDKQVITYNDSNNKKITDYREKVAKLSPEEQFIRLKFKVLPKLQVGDKRYTLQSSVLIDDKTNKFKEEGTGSIYEYPKHDSTDWTEVAKIYINPDLSQKAQLSFKVLDKNKTPQLYSTLVNNVR